MEGAGPPLSVQSHACQACQDLDTRWVHRCQALQGEGGESASSGGGGRVVVGRLRGEEGWRYSAEYGATLGMVEVFIDRTSMVGNPFSGADSQRLNMVYDELLGLIVQSDFDFIRHVDDYSRFYDDHLARRADGTHLDMALLRRVAEARGVHLHERDSHARLFCVAHVRAWLCFHASLLASGQSLCLMCHCAEGACPAWSCHGQSLAGALVWLIRQRGLDNFGDSAALVDLTVRPARLA